MFQRILVPLDGSAQAERAVPLAARLARATGGSLVLLRAVTHSHDAIISVLQSPDKVEANLEAQHAQAVSYLTHLANTPELADLGTALEVTDSYPAQTILSAARLEQVDSIVLCSHGTTGLTHWALGSVAQKVARQSRVPVLLLREQSSIDALLHAPTSPRPLRALVALDGSPRAEAVLLPAASLIAALSAPTYGELLLVLVLTKFEQEIEIRNGSGKSIKQHAEAYLETVKQRLIPRLGPLQVRILSSVVLGTEAASTLLKIAEKEDDWETGGCNVIAMTTHGRGGTALWVLGSVTERVLETTTHPLLIVRSQPLYEQE